ncbi:GTP pyrophosphokinase, partial [Streptomyces nitrosporeus]
MPDEVRPVAAAQPDKPAAESATPSEEARPAPAAGSGPARPADDRAEPAPGTAARVDPARGPKPPAPDPPGAPGAPPPFLLVGGATGAVVRAAPDAGFQVRVAFTPGRVDAT